MLRRVTASSNVSALRSPSTGALPPLNSSQYFAIISLNSTPLYLASESYSELQHCNPATARAEPSLLELCRAPAGSTEVNPATGSLFVTSSAVERSPISNTSSSRKTSSCSVVVKNTRVISFACLSYGTSNRFEAHFRFSS